MALRPASLLLVLAPVLCAATADVGRFRPPPTHVDLLGSDGATLFLPYQYSVGGVLSYAYNPLVWRYADDTYDPVIEHQLIFDATLAIGLLPYLDVGIVLPIALMQRGPEESLGSDLASASSLNVTAIGDLRLVPRLAIMAERKYGFGLAFISEITLPTGDETRFLGDPSLTWRPRLAATVPIAMSWPLRLTGSLGYLLRKNAVAADVEMGDEFLVHVGGELGIPDTTYALLLELQGATAASRPFAADGLSSTELLGGMRGRFADDVVLTLAAGVGLSQGLGVPDFRIMLGAAFAPLPPDRDGDGLPDYADKCPDKPEDYDGFEDGDGCPERDNDQDGILDLDDRCPDEPEDLNGLEDEDGCPDEGLYDKDGDGITDFNDRCPETPEDDDGFNDDDGCPESDNDLDGVVDDVDKCPDKKETINGVNDDDGCPDEGVGDTEYVEHKKIDIKATILFETNKSAIKTESKRILDQVALQILAHPGIKKVRIEGHTDSVGAEDDNLYLSQDRSDAVRRYLVQKGVDKNRLEATGFGETRPIDTNATAVGRSRNRRVEFVIVKQE